MRTIFSTVFLIPAFLLAAPPPSFSQPQTTPTQKPDKPAGETLNPELLVDQWFIRLNALDDWYISFDGKEETGEVVDRFVQLYSPAAFHQVGPSENQIGPVVFHGPEGIRKWATDFAKKHVQLGYRIDFMTRNEKPTQLVYSTKPPWGGTAAAFFCLTTPARFSGFDCTCCAMKRLKSSLSATSC
jgi:hypothetical protein